MNIQDQTIGWKGKTGIVLLVIVLAVVCFFLFQTENGHYLFIGAIVAAFLYAFVIKHHSEI